MTPQEASKMLEDAYHHKWRAEWIVARLAEIVMDEGEQFARAVSAEMGDGGRIGKLRRLSELSRAFPKPSPEYSPQQHRRWLNKDKEAS